MTIHSQMFGFPDGKPTGPAIALPDEISKELTRSAGVRLRASRCVAAPHELLHELTRLVIDHISECVDNGRDVHQWTYAVAAAGIDAVAGSNWCDDLIMSARHRAPEVLDYISDSTRRAHADLGM